MSKWKQTKPTAVFVAQADNLDETICEAWTPELAAQIVTEHNAHPELVEALEAARSFLDGVDCSPVRTSVYNQITQALSKLNKK